MSQNYGNNNIQWYNNQPYPLLQKRHKPHWIVQVLFWFFYPLVVIPVSFSITLTFAILATVLPLALPIGAIMRSGIYPQEWLQSNWLYLQGDAIYFLAYTAASFVGVAFAFFFFKTIKPWLRLHRAALRNLGGLKI